MTPEGNKTAHHNGKLMEETIQTLLPEMEFTGEAIDGMFLGAPLEIKSCRKHVIANFQRGKKGRSGRFWFRGDQHKKLIDEGGRYVLLVHEGEQIVSSRIVLASKLFNDFTGAKTATWKVLFNGVV